MSFKNNMTHLKFELSTNVNTCINLVICEMLSRAF